MTENPIVDSTSAKHELNLPNIFFFNKKNEESSEKSYMPKMTKNSTTVPKCHVLVYHMLWETNKFKKKRKLE